MLQKFAGPLVGGPFFVEAPVRPNMLNMPKSASMPILGVLRRRYLAHDL